MATVTSVSSSSSLPPSSVSSTTVSSTTTSTTTSAPAAPSSSSTTPPASSTTTTSLSSSTTPAAVTTSRATSAAVISTPTTSQTRASVVTSTSFLSVTASSTDTATPSSSASNSKSFFQNTGAVAGVFSVVGLIGLAILIALLTNAIRRRRAKKFDREIAEAARDAANHPAPVFLEDDDDDRYGARGGYGGGSGAAGVYPMDSGPYSDISSHGTYTQPPLSTGHETYGMREMGHGPAPGELYDYAGAGVGAAGAAGIGVARARSTRDGGAYGQALQDGASPYPAFAAPNPATLAHQQQHPYGRPYGTKSPELELLEAAGMGNHVTGAGAALGRGQSQYQRQPPYSDLGRNKSMGSREPEYGNPPASGSTGASQYYSPMGQSFDAHQAPQQQQNVPVPSAYTSYNYNQHQQPLQHVQEDTDDMDAAYGGYLVGQDGGEGNVNPFDGAGGRQDDGYSSGEDEPRRVLKVANQ